MWGSLSPDDDVTVRPGRGNLDESGPFGLLVKADGSASFIEFTFGETAVSAAALHLHNHWSNPAVPVDYDIALRGAPLDFDERTLTYASRPDDSGWTVVVDSFHVDDRPSSYVLDVTDFYNAHLGETIAFSLRSVRGSGDGPIFDDREGTGGYAQGPFIDLSLAQAAPVIEAVEPDPETAEAGVPYARQLVLLEGSPPVAWSVVRGPAGLVVDAGGVLSGWTPRAADAGQTFEIEVEARNAIGADRASWRVLVVTAPPSPLVGGGWVAHYYKPPGPVTSLPDLETLAPRTAAIVTTIDVTPTEGPFIPRGPEFIDDFAVRYEGRITLPEGRTSFHLTSDDGARLLLDGVLVVENGAGEGPGEASGAARLDAGEHCVVVEYFEHEGPAGIRVEYTPPGGARRVIPPSVMRPEPCVSGAIRVPRWRMLQIALTASGAPANPFTDIELTADATAPDGRTLAVDGYYDGDGRGGQEGNIWKLRLAPDEPGPWRWTARSNDEALQGRSGAFVCLPSESPGPVVAEGRHFLRAGDGPVYLLGNFLDRAAPAREAFSHTLLGEALSAADRQDMIRRHRDVHRANKMNVYLANRGDYGGLSTTPWLGSSLSNDRTRFDLARWRMYDEIIAQLRREGMIAELWFFADDSGFGDMPAADRQRLIRYGMARLGPYAHTMFVLALEWQEGWSPAEVRTDARFLQARNPWGRPVSVHGTTGNFAFPHDDWADFMATQSGNAVTPPANNAHTIANRGLAAKPLIVEEFGILEASTDRRLRGNLWAAFCGGAAGSSTGSELARLRRFIEGTGVRFWRMAPDNGLASEGFVLAERGAEYVVYVEYGRPFTLRLEAGDYRAAWFDPRASAGDVGLQPIGEVAGGVRRFAPPDPDDWVLYVTARLPGPGPAFIRGEPNADGRIDVADAVSVLMFLFAGGPAPGCAKGADANDDGALDIADPVYLLGYLFAGGPAPGAPFPACGPDPTADALSCDAYRPCEEEEGDH